MYAMHRVLSVVANIGEAPIRGVSGEKLQQTSAMYGMDCRTIPAIQGMSFRTMQRRHVLECIRPSLA